MDKPTRVRVEPGTPAVAGDLRLFIEAEFKRYGSTSIGGTRRIVLAPTLRVIAATLGCSEGTVKNALAALKREGYILKQDQGMYLILSNADSPSLKAPPAPQQKERPIEVADAESRRMSVNQVTSILRDVVMTCDIQTASKFIDAHRTWCVLNNLSPYI
jgi:DNA-binding transcriptional regulator YhcF (GntR family)